MTEANELLDLTKDTGDFRVSPAVGIASIALTMAMKYHDINTVQDGTLYQQYKLEGKNLNDLTIHDVFDTARLIEAHMLASSDRIAGIIIDALMSPETEDNVGE